MKLKRSRDISNYNQNRKLTQLLSTYNYKGKLGIRLSNDAFEASTTIPLIPSRLIHSIKPFRVSSDFSKPQ